MGVKQVGPTSSTIISPPCGVGVVHIQSKEGRKKGEHVDIYRSLSLSLSPSVSLLLSPCLFSLFLCLCSAFPCQLF